MTEDCSAIAGGEMQIPDVVEGKFNVAMVLIGPHDDGGWSQAHYEGLQYVCENVPDSHVAYVENVPEGADSEQVFRSLARKGFDFIIGTSFGYMDPMEIVAEEFPDSTFLHLTGYKSNGTNFGNFFGAMEDFKYLAGMLAGSRAKLDGNPKLGYMATFPIPEELRLGNAIMLGAKQTCPECTMDVRLINTWHDPTLGARGRRLAVRRRRPGRVHRRRHAGRRPGRRGEGQVGRHLRPPRLLHQLDACLTAPYWIWGPEYARIAEQVKAGTYVAGYEYFDADSGAMGLYGFMEGETPQPGIADLPRGGRAAGQGHPGQDARGRVRPLRRLRRPHHGQPGQRGPRRGRAAGAGRPRPVPQRAPGDNCETCMYWWADGINAELP